MCPCTFQNNDTMDKGNWVKNTSQQQQYRIYMLCQLFQLNNPNNPKNNLKII